MKKLLLFLMAFLLFAPPEAIAETKTVQFIGNPTATGSTSSAYIGWKYSADGVYKDEDGVTRTKYGANNTFSELGMTSTEDLGQIREVDGDIIVRFIYPAEKPAYQSDRKYITPKGTMFEFLIGGFQMVITSAKPDKITIKEIKFTQNKDYTKGMPNLTCSNGTCVENASDFSGTWTFTGNPSEVVFNVAAIGNGGVDAATGDETSDYVKSLLRIMALDITYEEIEAPSAPAAPKFYKSSNTVPDFEHKAPATVNLDNGDFQCWLTKDYPEGTKVYYYMADFGEDITTPPSEGAIEVTNLSDPITVSKGGVLCSWAVDAAGLTSEISSLEIRAKYTLFDLTKEDLKFEYLLSDGNSYWTPITTVKPNNPIKNIKALRRRIGHTDDFMVIEFDTSESNYTVDWQSTGLTLRKGTKFTVSTANRDGKIRYIEFSGLSGGSQNLSYDRLQTELIDNPFKLETTKATFDIINAPRHNVDFYIGATGSTVYMNIAKLEILADPAEVPAPETPVVKFNGQYSERRGVVNFFNTLDFTFSDPNNEGSTIYWSAFDENASNNKPETSIQDESKHTNGNGYNEAGGTIDGRFPNPGKLYAVARKLYTNANGDQVTLESPVVGPIYFEFQPATSFAKLSEIIKPENTGRDIIVIPSEEMTITGVYATRQNSGSPLSTYYAYVVDADGTAIKLVSTSPFPASYTAGAVIPASGLVGEFRYSYGAPEIVVSNYTGFLKEATPGTAPKPAEMTTISTSTEDGAIPDFNRKVVLRHAKWLRNTKSTMVEDADGNRYLIYSRLITPGVEASEFTEDMFTAEAGTLWAIEGYVGQVEGATAIFPTAKVLPCPETPTLLAPNPISGDVNAISPEVSVNVNRTEGYTYYYKTAKDGNLSELPEGGLQLKAEEYTAAPCSLWVYASANGLYSVEPAQATITWHAVKSTVTSIAEFKAEYLKDEITLPGSLTADKPGFSEEEQEKVVYHQFSKESKAIIVEATPEWLYIRDLEHTDGATEFTSANYLMIHNLNEWHNPQVGEGEDARDLAPGDIITNFAIIPAHTSRGNLVSESTGFARTVQYVGTQDDFTPVFEPIEVGYVDPDNTGFHKNITLGENERMRLVQLKNVMIKNPTEDVYTLVIGPDGAEPISLAFDIFTQSVNGFRTAYNPDNAKELYDIKGVLIRDNRIKDNETYAIALISFDTQHGAVAEPGVFVQGTTDAEAKAAEVQEFEHGLVVEIAPEEGSFVYYSLNGKDPLNNTDAESRISYTDPIPVTLPEGQDRVVVKAFAYRPGYKPSATVTRTFVKTSRELSYLLNFINQGEQDRAYHFNGNVRIAAVAGKWMMVRGSVGHYLPIYNADGWNTADYAAEGYLTDFLMTFDKSERNIRGIAKNFKPSTDKPADIDEIELTPDSVTFISEANARRYVKLHSALVHSAASAADASITEWTVTGTAHESSAHRLAVEMLDFAPDKLRDGGMYDIEGFVMLDTEGKAELWPLTATEIKQTERVEVKLNDVTLTPVSDASDASREYVAEFEKGALVTLFTSDTRESTKIYYSYDNEKWYTYGQPFLVLESADQIHAYAQAVGERASAHTHIKLTRKDVAAKVEFAIDNSIAGRASVTLTCATEGAKIYWWTSSNTKPAEYAKTLVFNESEVIYAYAAADGKADSEVSHTFIKIAGNPGTPEIPANKISGKVVFSIDDTSDPTKVTVYLAPEEGLTGTIYYLINPTEQVTPDNGLKYENPIEMKEGGRIVAILVESGKYAGEPTDIAVWLIPTDITGIDSEEREDAIRAEGGNIIAPEGSEVFDITGRRVNATGLRAGIYIVRTPGGKSVKVKVD